MTDYIVALVGNHTADLEFNTPVFLRSLHHLEDSNRTAVLLYHEGILPEYQLTFQAAAWPRPVHFPLIDFQDPPGFRGVPAFQKRSRFGYSHMISFMFSGMVARPELVDARYILRMDTDSCFTGPMPNVFEHMERLGASYVANRDLDECGNIVKGMFDLARSFAKAHSVPFDAQAISNDGGGECVRGFFNNLEALDSRRFRTSAIFAQWRDAVQKDGGIYRQRWGDAQLRRISLMLMGLPHVRWSDLMPGRRALLPYVHGVGCGGANPRVISQRVFGTPLKKAMSAIAERKKVGSGSG